MKKTTAIFLLMGIFQCGIFAQTTTIKVGSSTRNMIVYAPSGLSNPALIIQMHGMNQDAAYQKNAAKWETIADREKFVVVFPNGNNKSWDISGNTDIDFLKAIIDTMYNRYKIDRNRVYASGFSMGGMMSYHVANKMADKIAAIAPCSGYLFNNTASSSRPMPIIHIHGDADDVVGYSGVAGVLNAWRTHNGCPSAAQTTKPYPANKPNSTCTKQYWGPCKNNAAIMLLTNAGKGHWYSMDANGANSSEEIWAFFKNYSLNQTSTTSFSNNKPALSAVNVICENSMLQVHLPTAISAKSINLFDLNGHLVKALILPTSGSNYNFDLSDLPGGLYLVKLNNEKSTLHISRIMLTK